MYKEVFNVPIFAQANIEAVWGGKMRTGELETMLDLYNTAKEMGLIRMENKSFRRVVEVDNVR